MSTLGRSCAGVGSAIISVITMLSVMALGGGNEVKGFKNFTTVIAVVFIVFITLCCAFIKEKSTVDMQTASVGQMFKSLVQNDQAMTVVITIVLINISIYTTSNLVIYFFKYDMGGDAWYNSYTLFNTFGGGIQILSMMLLFPLLRKFFDVIKMFYVAFIMAIAGYVCLVTLCFIGNMTVYVLFIPAFFIFAANGILSVLTTIFLANTVDYGEVKNNRRDESVIFSMQTFVVKLASGVAALVASICAGICNFGTNVSSTDAAGNAAAGSLFVLRFTMGVVPIIGLLIAVFVFKNKYTLTEDRVKAISEMLKDTHEKAEA